MSWTDRAIGIVLGLVIGHVVVILLVFGGSSQSIDSPSLDHTGADQPAATTPK